MAKIGPVLQETRLKRGLTLERIADDTNISIRFLAKLENDDFTGFPGEPYIVGFIRNYAEYLGIDPNLAVEAYKGRASLTEEESAKPVEAPAKEKPNPEAESPSGEAPGEKKKKRNRKTQSPTPQPVEAEVEAAPGAAASRETPPAEKPDSEDKPEAKPVQKSGGSFHPGKLAIFLALAIAGLAAFWILGGGMLFSPRPERSRREPTEYRAEGSPYQTRLYPGDSILVPLRDEVYKLSLAGIGEEVELDTPFGRRSLSLGEGSGLDLDSDGSNEIDISIGDFERGKSGSGALVIVSIQAQDPPEAPAGEITVPGGKPGSPAPEAKPLEAGQAAQPIRVILKSTRGPYPFVVQVSFRGNCLFRYEADRKEWVEKYYSKGETITINASNQLTIWTSNAQAAKLAFQASGGKSVDFELGSPGEIAVKRISWDRSEGSWALVATTLD